MKKKYIEQAFPLYFVFGEHENGFVDIASINNDTVATVNKEHAENLIAERAEIVKKLTDMAMYFEETDPDAFDRFWYGS